MGTWGPGSFDNDDASDWIADFCDNPDETAITDTLLAVINTDGYLDASECFSGIAAAEVIAALKDAPNPNLSGEAKECIAALQTNADDDKVTLALSVIERIRAESELKELWEESEDASEWYQALDDLEQRLRS